MLIIASIIIANTLQSYGTCYEEHYQQYSNLFLRAELGTLSLYLCLSVLSILIIPEYEISMTPGTIALTHNMKLSTNPT